MVRGHHAFYAAGTVSTAHKMFEHDCVQCHQNWTLMARLNPFSSAKISSVKNEQCLACHPGEMHHANQVPAHGDGHAGLSCADCHREHRGNGQLATLDDQLCLQCHLDLSTHGGSERFALAIDRFDNAGPGGHPEFALDRLLRRDSQQGQGTESLVAAWRKYTDTPTDTTNPDDRGLRQEAGKFVDRGRIRFNHKVHLAETLPGPDRKPLKAEDGASMRENCQACHEPDDEGRYMRPIQYERHCQTCHPLLFDSGRFPGQVVPHADPNTVLGWLLQRYASPPASGAQAASVPDDRATPRVLEGSTDEDLRENLGPAERLGSPEARQLSDQAGDLLEAMPGPLVPETTTRAVQGGCRYCHVVEQRESTGTAFSVVPPGIPERWWLHAEFDHGSHTMLTCHQCHGRRGAEGRAEPVSTSELTEDVLLPGIDNCRACHASSPTSTPSASGARAATFESDSARLNGAGHRCVECHVYHAPPDPEWNRGAASQDTAEPTQPVFKQLDRRKANWKASSRFSQSSQ